MILVALVLVLAGATVPRSDHGYWTAGPEMAQPVTDGLVARLNDSRLLVAGGEAVVDGFPVSATQIYDPATDSWSFSGPMHHARIGGTATTLQDGRVLVIGGLGNKLQPLRTAEMFDPASGAWSETQPLPQTRFAQSATLLPDGRVLVVGGIVGRTISRTALFFDPVTATRQEAPPTTSFHAQQTTITLGGGRVLIAGGYGERPEIYDPQSRRWLPQSPIPERTHPVVLPLHTGSILLATGTGRHNHDLSSARVLDPATGRWTVTGSLHKGRNQANGAVLPDGRVLVAGGEQVTGHVLRSAEVYDPATGQWTATAPMLAPRDAGIVMTMPDGRVLVCGGMNFSGVLGSCEFYYS
jgi:N-acetylneuraminic acid mutarotase